MLDTYGTQQPIAFLKFLLEKDGFYDRGGDLTLKHMKDLCELTDQACARFSLLLAKNGQLSPHVRKVLVEERDYKVTDYYRLPSSNGGAWRRQKRGGSQIYIHVLRLQRHNPVNGNIRLYLYEHTGWTLGNIPGRSARDRRGIGGNNVRPLPGSPLSLSLLSIVAEILA